MVASEALSRVNSGPSGDRATADLSVEVRPVDH